MTTLMVIVRHRLNELGEDSFDQRFDKNLGFAAWFGKREPDDLKYFQTQDAALLALIVGPELVPGVEDS